MSLPNPLILLIHLHILEYPHANNPEYDHNIFNPRIRGLKERIKLMEDISYFLVSRIEGGKIGARTVLPVYPCVQISETVAFRTSLTKYLDSLRHHMKSSNTQIKGKGSDMAWWWKHVAVRRSLLEECAGEKFERVLLALSTHALMRKCSSPIAWDATSVGSDLNNWHWTHYLMVLSVFRSQPFIYATNLANYQSKRHIWSRRALILTRRQQDLTRLQKLLLSSTPASKYSSFSVLQLQALYETKMHDLLEGKWAGKEGQEALDLFIQLVGLKPSTEGLREAVVKDGPIKQPPPLPVAAAHHPSHLKKFRRPIFQTNTEPPTRSHAEIKLSERLESEKRMRQALLDTLSRTKKHQVELVKKLEALKLTSSSPTTHTLDSWTLGSLDWDPKPTREMFASLSLPVPPEDEALALETRIQQIREDLLTPYPPIPDPSAPRLLPLETSRTEPVRKAIASLTPARSIKRKSIRFSMAQKGRPSLFRIVDQLIDATEDHSDPESDSEFTFLTPKAKTKINRIWTSGTPKSTMKNTPRESFPMLLEPALSLPSLLSTEILGSDSPEQDLDFTPVAGRCVGNRLGNTTGDADLYEKQADQEEDIFDDDPPSMTLREILLNADANDFHLLEEEEGGGEGEDQNDAVLSGDESSFVWE